MPSNYRFSRALLVRTMGVLLVGVGALLLAVAAGVYLLDLGSLVLGAAVVAAVLVVLAAGLILGRLRSVVRLDDTGYQVSWVRGAGTRQARWRDVEDVVTATVAGHDCVVLRLKDGRTTSIPVRVLDADPDTFVRDLSAHLDRGHGYRRLS
jgi:hypothetical protein